VPAVCPAAMAARGRRRERESDPMSQFRDFAMQVIDKAKEKAGLNHGRSRLTDDNESDAPSLPFPAPPDESKLTIPQVIGAILVTALLAALVSSLLSGGKARTLQPSDVQEVGANTVNAGGDTAAGLGNNTNAAAPGGEAAVPLAEAVATLVDMVDSQNIRGHLESLYSIAMSNNGNRAMGTVGYNASVEYVLSMVSRLAGFRVNVFDFQVSKNQLDASTPATLSIPATSTTRDTDFSIMSNTGFGNVTGVLIPAGLGSDGASVGSSIGCNANGTADFAAVAAAVQSGMTVVALVERGSCFFSEKMKNAQAAGAKAVLIYNANSGPVFNGTLGASGDVAAYLPSLGLSSSLGRSLLDRYAECPWTGSAFQTFHAPEDRPRSCAPLEVRVAIAGRFKTIQSQNVIAETVTGDDTSILVVGAHLDSVEAGTLRQTCPSLATKCHAHMHRYCMDCTASSLSTSLTVRGRPRDQ